MIAARCDLPRGGRRKVQQRFDGAARAAAGTELEHLTEEHQHNNHRRGFKVDGNLALVLHRGWEHAGMSIAAALKTKPRPRPSRLA